MSKTPIGFGPLDYEYAGYPVQLTGQKLRKQYKWVEFPFAFGTRELVAGPYREKIDDLPGIKLAKEINKDSDISLDIPDFHVPKKGEAYMALYSTVLLLWQGDTPYVGCMGGKGRTGLFLALLAKAGMESLRPWWNFWGKRDPVKWVRQEYRYEAVETKEQEQFVHDFDVRNVAKLIRYLDWLEKKIDKPEPV